MAVLITGRLEEADRGEVARVEGVEEVVRVVLVVGRVAIDANAAGRRGPGVLQVLGGGVVLEGLVMRNVIRLVGLGDRRSGAAAAPGGSVSILDRQVEAALEESPADAGGVEQVTDVGARSCESCAPVVVEHTSPTDRVADQGIAAAAVGHHIRAGIHLVTYAVELAGDQVERAIGGGPKFVP